MNKAPWPDFLGHDIHESDEVQHPSGERGTVVFIASEQDQTDQWRVDYGDRLSRLCLQVGDKGQAVVVQPTVFSRDVAATYERPMSTAPVHDARDPLFPDLYCVLARNVVTDWRVFHDGSTFDVAEECRKELLKKFDIVRIYKFVMGNS